MSSMFLAKLAARFRRPDISFFYEFAKPPYGGGNQFLRALWREFARRGLRLETNAISQTTRACLYNSYNFDYTRLRRFRRAGCRMVHRVDGPIGVYRGTDDGTDRRIWEMNQELADATIFQSRYSLEAHRKLGFEFKSPVVIMNAVDGETFHPAVIRTPLRDRKIRLISVAWSENPNKGAGVYGWLERNLDWTRFDYTFVGRSRVKFERIRIVSPQLPHEVARLLREHDVYVTASANDPCSNSLLEALACGLPALYLNSGGHPEIVGKAGFGFSSEREVPGLLQQLVNEYEDRRAMISIPSLAAVADQYLAVMGLTVPMGSGTREQAAI